MPKRARGLVLGCLMMVAGPATAVLITTPAQGLAASASLVRSSVGEVDRLTNVIDPSDDASGPGADPPELVPAESAR